MGFYCNLCRFVATSVIHAVLSQIFCHNLCVFMWRKISPKSTFVDDDINKMVMVMVMGTPQLSALLVWVEVLQ